MSSFQDSNTSLEHESFGIKKIVDCKIGENGVQMYKVKWQATWEPAENLASCQQLIEDFWGFVNNAKFKERQRHVLQIQNKSCTDWCIPKLSMETKEEVWNMIAETNKTSSSVQSPSSALRNQQLSTHEQPPTSQRNQVEHEFKNTSLSTKTFHRDSANNVCAKCRNRVVRTPGKPGTPGILLEFHFPTWKTWKTWNFTHILLEILASALQKLFI